MTKGEWKLFDYFNYTQEIYFVDGNVHKIDGPAVINRTKLNNNESFISKELWYKNDIQHRDNNKPAVKVYNRFGKLLEIRYFVEGKRHRDNGASVITFHDCGNVNTLRYYKNNILSDPNKPSDIGFYAGGKKQYEAYYLSNRLHRNNGPAIIEYYKNGRIKEERYYKNGNLSRIDGPACILYNIEQKISYYFYYINDTLLSEEEYLDLVNRIKNGKIKRSINKFGQAKFQIVYELAKYYGSQELIDLFENRLIIEKMNNQ